MTLGERLGGPAERSAAGLVAGSVYRVIAAQLSHDLDKILEEDPHAGVGLDFAHRVFDKRWLSSSAARFELVGISNRLDRAPFAAGYGRTDDCGVIRIVYRLAYEVELDEGRRLGSRMPMTVNVVQRIAAGEDGSCRAAAKRWMAPQDLAGEALATWLRSAEGPLSDAQLASERWAGVAINLQQVRWPSSVHQSLGGHSEYLLRRWTPGEDGQGRPTLVRGTLENVPDVAKIKGSAALKKKLRLLLRDPEQLAALDQGIFVLPQEFLDTRAVSVAPRGMERLANRPFSQVVYPRYFKRVDFSKYKTIDSPRALIRRLDALSCQGCHQARSHAGFHLLGEDPPDKTVDAMFLPVSPHLAEDLARRARRMLAQVRGEPLTPAIELQPSAERDGGRYGSHCRLEEAEGFAGWGCDRGLSCAKIADEEIGHCLPRRGPGVGDPCEIGPVTQWRDPRKDRGKDLEPLECRGSSCVLTDGGFPLGMCKAYCGASKRVTCGVTPTGGDFNGCLAARRPWIDCVTESSRPAGLRGCDHERPCRDDFLCARTPESEGACLPPYFLFQLRLDGHPEPM